MPWTTNPIMEWSLDGNTWTKVSDHGRSPLTIGIERIETKQRMANGTMRRYVVAKKRTFSCSWDNLPSVAHAFLANGEAGEWIENWHNTVDGSFKIRLRRGSDDGTTNPTRDGTTQSLDNQRIFTVMFTDFSKEVVKRGKEFDLWSVDITLEEV